MTLLSHALSMPDFTVQMVAMIGLGVGIDYALFIVQRFREGLDHGHEVEEAIVEAIDTSGRAVLFAGTAVLISLCGMFLMGMAFMNGLAIGAIVGVLMMMAVSLTLLPAFLAICGRRVNETHAGGADRRHGLHHRLDRRRADVPNPMPFLDRPAARRRRVRRELLGPVVADATAAPRPEAERADLLVPWSRLVQHRPWPMLVAGVAILVIR